MKPIAPLFFNAPYVMESVFCVLQQLGPVSEEALGKLNDSIDAYQANQILKWVDYHSVALVFFFFF